MKYYLKYLLLAVFCGFFCILGCTRNSSGILLSELLLIPAFNNVDYYFQYIPEITNGYIPLLLFQLFYGTYIYRHFCCAGIYYFSRNCNRIRWFIKESLCLYVFAVGYLVTFLVSGVIATAFFVEITVDAVSVYLFLYYILIYSFFLWFTTLAVNLFAILFTSNSGFVMVESFIFLCMGIYTMNGEFFIPDNEPLRSYQWLIKMNPFSHLQIGIHSSKIKALNSLIHQKDISFDLNESVLLFAVLSVVMVAISCLVVQYHDFIDINKEAGGV